MKIKVKQTILQPLHDRIVVTRREVEEDGSAFVVTPDNTKQKPQQGDVIWVGTGKILEDGRVIPVSVAPGDVVLFGMYGGADVEVGGQTYLILREDEIMGKIQTIEVEEEVELDGGSVAPNNGDALTSSER